MRFLVSLLCCVGVLAATPAMAEMKIAVLNYQVALLESNTAKKYAVDAEKKFKPQLARLKKLEEDAKAIQAKLAKSGDSLSQTERERLQSEFQQKARDFQFQSKEINEAKALSDREMLKTLKPKMDQAIEEVLKDGDYDLVLERSAVIDVKPKFDITRQVIDLLNKQK